VLAELRRVLKERGRLAVVALDSPPQPSLAVSAYRWLHGRFPHWIDCRPVRLLSLLSDAGYASTRAALTSVCGLPVMTALAFPRRGSSRLP
jgi:demethylmenaquinone methyltransferase/2-methoxy-6-polyprenyl-1,4-benzoquinol methylase